MKPSDAPDLSRFRLVKLFTSCTDDDIKAQIISSFTSESPLKIGSFWEGFRLYRCLPGDSCWCTWNPTS